MKPVLRSWEQDLHTMNHPPSAFEDEKNLICILVLDFLSCASWLIYLTTSGYWVMPETVAVTTRFLFMKVGSGKRAVICKELGPGTPSRIRGPHTKKAMRRRGYVRESKT